mmetsp:Transcript_26180/g.63331  ORF Transcript_26180/g.63331 Transcript_26180/m.63331 type:complete len:326 (+) Transcript_26180:88-1065(+)
MNGFLHKSMPPSYLRSLPVSSGSLSSEDPVRPAPGNFGGARACTSSHTVSVGAIAIGGGRTTPSTSVTLELTSAFCASALDAAGAHSLLALEGLNLRAELAGRGRLIELPGRDGLWPCGGFGVAAFALWPHPASPWAISHTRADIGRCTAAAKSPLHCSEAVPFAGLGPFALAANRCAWPGEGVAATLRGVSGEALGAAAALVGDWEDLRGVDGVSFPPDVALAGRWIGACGGAELGVVGGDGVGPAPVDRLRRAAVWEERGEAADCLRASSGGRGERKAAEGAAAHDGLSCAESLCGGGVVGSSRTAAAWGAESSLGSGGGRAA